MKYENLICFIIFVELELPGGGSSMMTSLINKSKTIHVSHVFTVLKLMKVCFVHVLQDVRWSKQRISR